MKTLQELEDMPDDKLRVMLAELDGWKWNAECDLGGKAFPECWTHDDHNMAFYIHDLPNYPADLNACHEVEKTHNLYSNTDGGLRHPYWLNLLEVTRPTDVSTHCATARQRTIALILTLQKP